MFEFLPTGFFSHLIVRTLQQSQSIGAQMTVEQHFKNALLLQGHDLKMVIRIVPYQLKASYNQNVLSVQVRLLHLKNLTMLEGIILISLERNVVLP